MTNLEHKIVEIQKELSEPINKSEFIAKCALEKIEARSNTYDQEIDNYLKFLNTNEINSRDLTRMTHTLTSLSSLITKSYDGLLTMISQCEKNIFKK